MSNSNPGVPSVPQEVMDAVGVSRDSAKELYLRLSNGGTVQRWATETHESIAPTDLPSHVWAFQQEMQHNVPLLLDQHPLGQAAMRQQMRRKPNTTNPMGSQLAYLLQVRLHGRGEEG
jgi:hypothetical protein